MIRPVACWSPDARWIAYETRNPGTSYDGIALYQLEDKTTVALTDAFGSAEAATPVEVAAGGLWLMGRSAPATGKGS